MHTLSVFPALFDFELIAPLVLRLALAYALGRLVWNEKHFSSLEQLRALSIRQILQLVVAFLIAVGLYTQVATIAAIILVKLRWFSAKKRGTLGQHDTILCVTMAAVAVSLLFLGAGFLAFDLPL